MNDQLLDQYEMGYSTPPTSLTQDNIVFDGYSLQNTSFITEKLDFDDESNVELNSFKFPRIDGGSVLSKYYRGRTIKLKWTVKSDTATNYSALLDTVKKRLRTTEGYLEIRVGTEIRHIKATVTDIKFTREHYNITFSPIEVTFVTVEPYFYAKTDQSQTYAGKTGTFTEEMVHNGSAEKVPNIYFVFNAGTTVSAFTFTDPSGRVLSITSALTNGDVIYIDGDNRNVKKNGVAIDFSGSFPIFQPGSNNFTATFTGSVACDTTIILQKNYL